MYIKIIYYLCNTVKENIELHIIHNPKITTEDNGFAIAIFINGVDKNVLELSEEQMLHIGDILLNASRKFKGIE